MQAKVIPFLVIWLQQLLLPPTVDTFTDIATHNMDVCVCACEWVCACLTRWPRSCPAPSPRSSGRGQPWPPAARTHSSSSLPGSWCAGSGFPVRGTKVALSERAAGQIPDLAGCCVTVAFKQSVTKWHRARQRMNPLERPRTHGLVMRGGGRMRSWRRHQGETKKRVLQPNTCQWQCNEEIAVILQFSNVYTLWKKILHNHIIIFLRFWMDFFLNKPAR